jgi:predicted ABC-type ATPase
MRMFAGPNGSGKSSLKGFFPSEWIGHYINPDEMEAMLKKTSELNIGQYDLLDVDERSLHRFFDGHALTQKLGQSSFDIGLKVVGGTLTIEPEAANSYIASVLSDWLRRSLIEAKATFSFETVMSSPDKIELLKQAKEAGYQIYLYYISTQSVDININRVSERYAGGGHNVPVDKIRSRYINSLNLLSEAIDYCYRAYLFDNSLPHPSEKTSFSLEDIAWVAEVTPEHTLILDPGDTKQALPNWVVEYVVNKLKG